LEGKKKRIPTWLVFLGLVVSLPFLVAGALWEYMNATAVPLHPVAEKVPSEASTAPLPRWADSSQQSRELIRAVLAEQNLPGVSVAVGAGGDIVWAEGFGFADIENQAKVTPATRFRIGTASIALTSAAAGLLIEEGRLKLDEKIQTYVPEYPEKPWPVTLRQLMAHVAAVGSDGGDEGPLFTQHCPRPMDALRFFAKDSLRFEPGTDYRHSSYGWILVSVAVEAAANEPFLSFMGRRILGPLGMGDTLPDAAIVDPGTGEYKTVPAQGQAASYFPRFAGDPRYGPDPMRPLEYSCYAGSSVFVSTPTDLARFAMGIHSGKLLQPQTVKVLQTSQRLRSGQETGYGLGWSRAPVAFAFRETEVIGHDGEPARRDGHFLHDISRVRRGRGRGVEYLVRGHPLDGGESRRGLRATRQGAAPPSAWDRTGRGAGAKTLNCALHV